MWPRRKKPSAEGLKSLLDFTDESIMLELKTLPQLLPFEADDLTRGSALWLAMIQDEPIYEAFEKDIVTEIRALDAYMAKRAKKKSGGMPTFFAYLYYMVLWHNTVRRNPEFVKFSAIANTPKDDNRGYA